MQALATIQDLSNRTGASRDNVQQQQITTNRALIVVALLMTVANGTSSSLLAWVGILGAAISLVLALISLHQERQAHKQWIRDGAVAMAEIYTSAKIADLADDMLELQLTSFERAQNKKKDVAQA